MANRTPLSYPRFRGLNTSTGDPLAGGKLYTYEPGTTTPKTAYSDADLTVAHTNPIILDANGESMVFLNGAYKLVLDDASDVNQWTEDNLAFADPNSSTDYAVDSGAADAYVITGVDAQSLTAGLKVAFLAGANNTGASTLNVNSLGVKSIVNLDSTALRAAQIKSGMIVEVRYDGTNWQLLGITGPIEADGVVTASITDLAVTIEKMEQDAQDTLSKAWVNFNGTGTVAINDSHNVTSITDNGTGDYTVNFTNALPNANYAVALTGCANGPGDGRAVLVIHGSKASGPTLKSTTQLQIFSYVDTSSPAAADDANCNVVVFGA